MKATFLLAILAVVLIGAPSSGAQLLKDPGTFTCEKWTMVREGPLHNSVTDGFADAITAWTQGYFAGSADLAGELTAQVTPQAQGALQESAERTRHMLDAEQIPTWLDAYCRAYPTATVRSATHVLLRQAYSRR